MIMKGHPRAYDFRNLEAPAGFHNINEIADLSTQPWLHPVQSLYGNWGGRHLILGQDLNSWENLFEKKAYELKHDPDFTTNKHLERIFGEGFDAIYANLSWFIKGGETASAPINFTRAVMAANEPVLKATISAMPNLQTVYCLGAKVFEALSRQKYAPLTKCRTVLFRRSVELFALPHTGGLGLANFQNKTGLNREAALNKIQDFVRT